uniref:Uncharacterized protein n=1 Tax=Siphoviridae sp. cteZR38 TaxID=2827906 RepID=A0A8S5SP37_9CAUD|nr:MAG TPA: hypothetical protein [Siphoviridae sp. cteZR38]
MPLILTTFHLHVFLLLYCTAYYIKVSIFLIKNINTF